MKESEHDDRDVQVRLEELAPHKEGGGQSV